MINMAPGLDKGQFGQSMHQFEAITTSDPAQPADLRLPWRPCEQEMTHTLHDSILNTFIMFLVGSKTVNNCRMSQLRCDFRSHTLLQVSLPNNELLSNQKTDCCLDCFLFWFFFSSHMASPLLQHLDRFSVLTLMVRLLESRSVFSFFNNTVVQLLMT